MTRRLAAVLAGCALAQGAASPARAQTEEAPFTRVRADKVRELAERVAKEVVFVEVTRKMEGAVGGEVKHDGGGFHAGDGRIVTSAFLVKDAEGVRVRLHEAEWQDAKVERVEVRLGLAILRVDAAKARVPSPEIAPASPVPVIGATAYLSAKPAVGQPGLTIGYWMESPGRAFYGRASHAAINGHPLYDDFGRVSGLTVLPARPGIGCLVVPAWALRKLLGLPTKTEAELDRERLGDREHHTPPPLPPVIFP